MNTKQITTIALSTALLCIVAPLSIPLSFGVPLSLATLIVMLNSLLLEPKDALISTALYLFIGSIGLPVFSNYQAGFSILLGPTGGFLVGYLFLAFFTSFFDKKWIGMLIGHFFLYSLGALWFSIISHTPFISALSLCILPFIPFDSVKCILILLLAPTLLHLRKTKQKGR